MDEHERCLFEGLAALGVADPRRPAATLLAYLALLEKWNRAYNLTAVRDPAGMVTRHILDSATALPWITGERVIDVGSGAGLPGIVLAVLDPARHYTLLDSGGKKARFMRHAATELGLANVAVVHERAERHAGRYHTVVCRAFASLAEFVRHAGALAENPGRLVAMKGKLPGTELRDLPAGWRDAGVHPVDVPGLDARRHIVVLAPVNEDAGRDRETNNE